MNLARCERCGSFTPEGISLCPLCMREAGASDEEVEMVTNLLDVISMLNAMDGTGSNVKTAIQSILKTTQRIEDKAHEEKEKEKSS